MGLFDTIRTWTGIEVDVPTSIYFEDDEPCRSNKDSFQNTQYIFEVNHDELIGISSKPLLRALKPFSPLGGKTLIISRSGRGYDTAYNVEEVV